MSGKNTKLIIVLSLIFVFALGAILLFLNFGKLGFRKEPVVIFPESPQKGDYGYQEPQTKVTIGTQGVSKGTFEKVDGENILILSDSSLTQYPLTQNEVVLSCTKQDLANATELDYDQVTKIKISNPAEIGGLIPKDEAVVLFAQDVEGVMRVHTVAIDASKCPS